MRDDQRSSVVLAPESLADEVLWLARVERGLHYMGAEVRRRTYDPDYNEGMPEPKVGAFCYTLVWPEACQIRYVLNMSVFHAG